MKAIVWTTYGGPDSLQLREVAIPTPKANEVLIRVRATTVTAGEVELRRFRIPFLLQIPVRLWLGLIRPRSVILGQELAGDVAATGKGVTHFKTGDPVLGWTGLHLGAYAEYVCLPAKNLVAKPAGIPYDAAATLSTGGINALYFLRVAQLQPGEHVLLYGAGGSIGTYAVQLAKSSGAEVTVVDGAEKLAMLRALGADHAVDYRQTDFSLSGATYDVIIDIVGKSPYAASIRALKPGGRYILGNASLPGIIRSRWGRLRAQKRVIVAVATYTPEAYAFLIGQMASGRLTTVIDRRYPLAQTADAHQYVEDGHKQGNVVITVAVEAVCAVESQVSAGPTASPFKEISK